MVLIKDFSGDIFKVWKKYRRDLFAALVLALSVFVFHPLDVYQKNLGAVSFNLVDIWHMLLILGLAVFLASALLASLIHKFLFKYISVIYFAMILCLWVQGNFLTYDLGALNGQTVNWSMFRNWYIVEFFVWAGLITAAVWFRKMLYKNLGSLLVALLLLEVIPLAINGFEQLSSHKTYEHYYYDHEYKYEFSSEKNVVIIILDTARTDAFQQILARTPAYQNTFKDFTFFSNSTGGYPTTKPSIPLILSGEYFDNSISFNKYLADTQGNSLPSLLRINGYAVENYSWSPVSVGYQSIWSNLSALPSRADVLEATNQLYLVAFLRYLPLSLKPLILDQYYKGNDYWGQDMVDLYNNVGMSSKTDKGPVFKFIHLSGAHPPFQLDKSLQVVPDSTYLDQFEGGVLAIDRLLQAMKDVGVYNNSLILIMGDHGTESSQVIDQNEFYQPYSFLINAGTPLLLAKNFNQEQDEIAISLMPVALSDVPKTVMDALGLENQLPGLSIFSDIPERRSRIFYFYKWRNLDWNSDYLPPAYKFEVTGNAQDANSWRFTGEERVAAGQVNMLPTEYQYGEDILAESNSYFGIFSTGFSFVEKTNQGVWATGPVSCLFLPVKKDDNPLFLSFSVLPFLEKEHLPKQELNILAGKQIIESVQLNNSSLTALAIPLPADLANDKELDLCFEFPDAQYSPKDLGMNQDVRYLGGLFNSIIIDRIFPFSLPVEFKFGENGNATIIKNFGWSHSESQFTWTDGHIARLLLPLNPDDAENIQVTLSAFPFTYEAALPQQMVVVRSKGIELGRWTMEHEGEYAINIPSNYIENGFLDIEFEMPNAASPLSLGIGQDPRVLGMAVQWIRLEK